MVALLMLLAAGVFCLGIGWGLPSRALDSALFGERPVWSGSQILQLAGGWTEDADRGADVDADPLSRRDEPVELNTTDARRAAIVLRYRLYSRQPDEMISFRALARMSPGQLKLDPGLYQYGGLWVYPIGALLKVGSVLRLVTVTGDLTYYLDHPEAFGRFYVVARLYSAMWGVAGVAAVFWIARRLGGGMLMPSLAGLLYTFMPVVVNMAHEAKPHLPGAVLTLLAVVAAARFVETARRRWWLTAGALCGAASGMVISSLWAFSILPVMALLWRREHRRTLTDASIITLGSALAGVAVYAVTNPYVWINAIWHPELLRSNLSNSTAMYNVGRWGEGLLDATRMLLLGTSPVLGVAGMIGGIGLVVRTLRHHLGGRCDGTCAGRGDVGILLLAPCAILFVQFIALAAGKPPEYARFAILIDVALAIAAVAGLQAAVRSAAWRRPIAGVLLLGTLWFGGQYVLAFYFDAHARTVQQARLASVRGRTIGLYLEPAPFSLPATDLFDQRLVLLPQGAAPVGVDVAVWPAGFGPTRRDAESTPISWASKRFVIRQPPPRP